VKTLKFKNPRYLGDPINAVKIFNGKGVDELCILDIDASKNKKSPNINYIKQIASEAFMPLSYGGGITTLDQIKEIFYIGYEKVIINTAFINNPSLVTEAAKYAGSQSIVVAIDVKTGFLGKRVCCVDDGEKILKEDPVILARRAEELGAGELLINSINNDGMMKGYDYSLISDIARSVSIPMIACGGAGKISDFRVALKSGAHAVAAGSLFVYYGDEKAVLITVPSGEELVEEGVYQLG
jgi:cyclase